MEGDTLNLTVIRLYFFNSSREWLMVASKIRFSSSETEIFVEVEPGLMANILYILVDYF